jgi:hypothetical protein
VSATANATKSATITPITKGDQNPDEEVEVGGKVGTVLLLPFPLLLLFPLPLLFPFPLLLPFPLLFPVDPEFGVGEDETPPITVKVVAALLPLPSVADTVDIPEGHWLFTVTVI